MRSVEVVEREWDAESYGLMAALEDYEAALCPMCGNPIDECRSAGPGGDFFYEAPLPSRCYATDAALKRRADYDQNPDVVRPEALSFGAVRKPRPRRRPTRGATT